MLRHDVLPVVMGAGQADYAAVAPHNSYVHVDEFAGPKELAAYLHRLDKDDRLYNSYFKWKVCRTIYNIIDAISNIVSI